MDKVASIVHAAKNRLQLLEPALTHLQDHPDPEVRQSGLTISQQLDDVNQQLVLMLSLYRLDHTQLVVNEGLSLLDLLDTAVARVNDPRIVLDDVADKEIFGDERLLLAVLGDALHNALRHCRKEVRVTARDQVHGICIQVIDDGCEGDTRKSEGNGVGLWIANRIAEALRNGQERGYAKHGFDEELGSCFELYVP